MDEPTVKTPDYGNWVSTKLLLISGLLSVLFIGLSFLLPVLAIGAAFFGLAFAYFAYARHQFSPRGGNVQARIHALVLERLDWDGAGGALDIGCGNAPLAVKLAQKYPGAQVTGIDYWGAGWDYSREACERNAEIAGVADRTSFRKASAASLPFEDGFFDAAVSNFVFHEVRDAKDKRDVLKEALRVVKKGGRFAFQDLFLIKGLYGEVDDLLGAVRGWGVEDVQFVKTSGADFIPYALKLPFMVGTMAIICGTK
jgi:SAM-dependent methyltransferase